MSFLRVISALLLAVVLLAVAFGGFWLVALRYAEAALTRKLADNLGAVLTYGPPQWQPDLTQVHVVLPNVVMELVPAGGNGKVVMRAQELELMSSFFDQNQRLVVRLPKQVAVDWTDLQGTTRSYVMQGERVEVTFLQKRGLPSVMVRTPAARMTEVTGGMPQMLLQLTDGYLGWVPTAENDRAGAWRLELGMRNVASVGGRADDLLLRLDMLPPPEMSAVLVNWLSQRTGDSWQALLAKGVQWLQGGGTLFVDHALMKQADYEVAAFGQLKVDTTGLPAGNLSLTTNKGSRLAAAIANSGLLKNGDVEEMFRRSQVLDRLAMSEESGVSEAQVQMVSHQGHVIMNTQRVGPVNSYGEMIGQWR